MSTYDLNSDQMLELKQYHMCEEYDTMGLAPSYGELLDAGETYTDEYMHEEYRGFTFSAEDFFYAA